MRTNLLSAALILALPAGALAQRPASPLPPRVPGDDKAPVRGDSPYPYTSRGFVVDGVVNAEAALLREELFRSRSDTRLRVARERAYIAAITPTWEERRQAAVRTRIEQALNSPPDGAIRSGSALNDLAAAIRSARRGGGRGPSVGIDPDVVRRINWTAEPGSAGPSMLRDGAGGLAWPALLGRDRFGPLRRQAGARIDEAVAAARAGSADTARAAEAALAPIDELREAVRGLCREPGVTDSYVEATGFLRRLGEAVSALKRPGAGQLLDRRVVDATTVAGLLEQMAAGGLRVAPAAPGDERCYVALYEAMTEHYRRLVPGPGVAVVMPRGELSR